MSTADDSLFMAERYGMRVCVLSILRPLTGVSVSVRSLGFTAGTDSLVPNSSRGNHYSPSMTLKVVFGAALKEVMNALRLLNF